MPYAIELALDPEAAAAVRATWDALARAGIEYMATCGARPHVSLGIWDAMDVGAAPEALDDFARTTPPLPITFDRIDAFPGGVVFLAPRADDHLVAAQRRLHRSFAHGRGAWAHYEPGTWVPHCTMAMEYPVMLAPVAREIVTASTALPLRGRLADVEIVQFRPVRTLFTRPLGLEYHRSR
jgi:2'-5' RNA ligase